MQGSNNGVDAPSFLPGSIAFANEIPDESPIFISELCAAILMICLAIDWPREMLRTCVLFGDTQDSVAALVKGSSSSPLGAMLVCLFRNCVARGATLWWVEYVHTKSNSAASPSRDCNAHTGAPCDQSTGTRAYRVSRTIQVSGIHPPGGHDGDTKANRYT